MATVENMTFASSFSAPLTMDAVLDPFQRALYCNKHYSPVPPQIWDGIASAAATFGGVAAGRWSDVEGRPVCVWGMAMWSGAINECIVHEGQEATTYAFGRYWNTHKRRNDLPDPGDFDAAIAVAARRLQLTKDERVPWVEVAMEMNLVRAPGPAAVLFGLPPQRYRYEHPSLGFSNPTTTPKYQPKFADYMDLPYKKPSYSDQEFLKLGEYSKQMATLALKIDAKILLPPSFGKNYTLSPALDLAGV